MYKKELARAGVKLDLKPATPLLVYNMLQDMRHLVILDFREQDAFDAAHIRKSVHVDSGSYEQTLFAAFNSKQSQTQYQGDDLRRVLFILPGNCSIESKLKGEELLQLDQAIFKATNGHSHIHKAYSLKDFDAFHNKCPYMCLPQSSERDTVLAESRFPSEIKQDALWLGNLTNVLGH